MKYSKIRVTGAIGRTGSVVADQCFATATEKTHEICLRRLGSRVVSALATILKRAPSFRRKALLLRCS